MSRIYYGDSLDARILELFEAGAVAAEITAQLGVSVFFLRGRTTVLGIRAELAARGRSKGFAKRRKRIAPPVVRTQNWLDRLGLAARADDGASRVFRMLRWHRPAPDVACIDPDNVVALAHRRGLTLPEIHEAFGVPPAEAVAAIRAHHGSLAA